MALPDVGPTPAGPKGAAAVHGRLEFLDAVRGLAALAVVVNHVVELDPAYRSFFLRDLNLGALGVSAFFVVSGFIIPFSLERANDLRRFWIGRVFRVWPLYLFTLFVVTAWCLVAPGIAAPSAGYKEGLPGTFLTNLTMLQGLSASRPSAIGAYWTLAYELLFYIVCSLLFALRILKRAEWFAAATVALGFALVGAGIAHVGASPKVEYLAVRSQVALMFALGMLMVRLSFGEVPKRTGYAILGASLALCVAVAALVWQGPTPADKPSDATLIRSYLAGYGLFFAFYALRRREFPRWLTYLGEISFSVYLMHGLFLALGLSANLHVRQVLVVVLTAVFSPLTYRYIERPAVALGRRLAQAKPRPVA